MSPPVQVDLCRWTCAGGGATGGSVTHLHSQAESLQTSGTRIDYHQLSIIFSELKLKSGRRTNFHLLNVSHLERISRTLPGLHLSGVLARQQSADRGSDFSPISKNRNEATWTQRSQTVVFVGFTFCFWLFLKKSLLHVFKL